MVNNLFMRGLATLKVTAMLIAVLAVSGNAMAAAIDLNSDSSNWAVVMDGGKFDAAGDQQANSADLELVGGLNLPLLYTQYDDNGTPSDTSDDTVAYRVRVSGQKTTDYSAGYMFLGFDLNLDGVLDYFLSVSGKNTSGGIVGWNPGADLNTSPSTTSITNPTQIIPLDFTAGSGNVSFIPVDATTNSAVAPNFDSDGANGTDYFLSFKLSFDEFKASALAKSGITVTPQTPIQYTLATSTNPNSYTSDVGGYNGKTDDTSVSYADQGAFSPATSLSNIYPTITSNGGGDTASISVNEGTTAVTTVTASDSNGDTVTFSISSEVTTANADSGLFSIDSTSGALTFNSAPSYASPSDNDGNGTYQVVVIANDGNGGTDSQAISVIVLAASANIPGSVSIDNTAPSEGDTLTATVSDTDGTTTSTITYTWKANGTTIASSTSNTYLLTQAEVGKTITVTASYTDDGATTESPTSSATAAVANTNNPGSVAISGTATEGQTLTATVSDTDGTTTSTITYTWKANGTTIASSTSNTYLLTQAEVGKTITVTASYTDDGATAENPTSSATSVVSNVNQPGSVAISGTATEGQTLTATVSDTDGTTTSTITYTWKANGTTIASSTSNTYLLTQAEVGKTITVTASYTDDGATAESPTSSATAAVITVNNVGNVSIDNTTPSNGDTLTATVSDTDGTTTSTITYTWKANGTTIASSTSNTYLLTQAEVGKTITVTASYTDDGATDENPTSAATAAVLFISTEDTDGDGISNGDEGYGDNDGDGVPDYLDLDSDNDGIPDAVEGNVDSDGDSVPDYLDLDSDNDGLYDLVESGITDPTSLDTNNDGRIDSRFGSNGLADVVENSADSGNLNYTIADSDGDGYEDFRDLDSDNDGINDVVESGGNDDDNDGYLGTGDEGAAVDANGVPSGGPLDALDNDGDLIPNYRDLDSDNDGTYDVIEAGGSDPDGDGYVGDGTETDKVDASGKPAGGGLIPVDTDGDTVADYLDLDSDNDGIPDVTEAGGTDQGNGRIGGPVDDQGVPSGGALPPVDTDNDGTEDRIDLDSDNDGINDIIEAGGTDSAPAGGDGMVDGFVDNNSDGYDDGLASTPLLVPDSDNDGTPDFQDNGDLDNDGVPDDLDLDDDNDGIPDSLEGSGAVDTDQDGVPDSRDLDSDNDGIFDLAESGANNPEQLDTDNDGRIDNGYSVGSNGLADVVESSPESGIVNYNGGNPVDSDGDGIEDFRDLDNDNDGIPDVTENGGNDPDGDGIVGSGIPSVNTDGITSGTGITTIDTDGDGTPNYLDLDSDNDGASDLIEAGGSDTNGDGMVDNFTDTDGNGFDDNLNQNLLPLLDGNGDGLADYVQTSGGSKNQAVATGVQGIGGCTVAVGAPFDPMMPLLLLLSLAALNRRKIRAVLAGEQA